MADFSSGSLRISGGTWFRRSGARLGWATDDMSVMSQNSVYESVLTLDGTTIFYTAVGSILGRCRCRCISSSSSNEALLGLFLNRCLGSFGFFNVGSDADICC